MLMMARGMATEHDSTVKTQQREIALLKADIEREKARIAVETQLKIKIDALDTEIEKERKEREDLQLLTNDKKKYINTQLQKYLAHVMVTEQTRIRIDQ